MCCHRLGNIFSLIAIPPVFVYPTAINDGFVKSYDGRGSSIINKLFGKQEGGVNSVVSA